jgi:hypothetical protein
MATHESQVKLGFGNISTCSRPEKTASNRSLVPGRVPALNLTCSSVTASQSGSGYARPVIARILLRVKLSMGWQTFDALVTHVARLLEVIFFFGAAGSAYVIVLTAIDILTDILTPDTHAKHEIDALRSAA